MKILVTGGAGYIGSHAVLALLNRGDEVIIFDNLEYGHREAVERINANFDKKAVLIKGDLRNKEDLAKLFQEHLNIEAVLHFAAYALVGESVENPGKYYENNVCGSLNLFSAMLENNIKKLVFSSTCATYGEPETIPISENEKQSPINPYGRSKLMIEQILDDFYNAYGFNSIRLRYFNAAGASIHLNIGEDHDPETHLIPIAMKTALGIRDKIYIFGEDYNTPDGTCVRDYIHVEDLIDAHLLGLDKLNGDAVCEYCNLGAEKGYSVKEIIDKAKQVTGKKFKVEIGDRRPGDPDKLVADSAKAGKILNWSPKLSLDDIIQSAWKWHRNNPKGFEE